jgi:hypothetical protein
VFLQNGFSPIIHIHLPSPGLELHERFLTWLNTISLQAPVLLAESLNSFCTHFSKSDFSAHFFLPKKKGSPFLSCLNLFVFHNECANNRGNKRTVLRTAIRKYLENLKYGGFSGQQIFP